MIWRLWKAWSRFWAADQCLSALLVLLVVVIFVLPLFVRPGTFVRSANDVVLSLLLVTGAAVVSSERRLLRDMVSACTIVTLYARWVHWLVPPADLVQWYAVSRLIALSTLALVVLVQVFRRGPVTFHRIQGAIAVYLLLGLTWANAYELMSLLHPGAFAGAVPDHGTLQHWIYYSFVTLTTVGYGDVTPVHPAARSLAMLEALIGQLYPAILASAPCITGSRIT